jgi:hypothetical protein
MKPCYVVVCLALFASIQVPTARTETTEVIDRAQMARDQTVSPLTGTATSTGEPVLVTSPNDADLGEQEILRRTKTYQPFVASVAVPIYWTSNVALTNSGEQDDLLISPVAAVAYQPRMTRNLSGYISVRDQQFYYSRLTDFDFGSFDTEVGLTYTVRQVYNLVLRAGYDYNRLTDKNSFDDFFSNHILVLSAELPMPITRSQQISVGMDANISLGATPDLPRRHDFDTFVGYSVQLTRAFVVSASGRLAIHDYTDSDRLDVSELVALNATYSLTRLLSASALTSFGANQSNQSVFDYQVVNAGGTIAFTLRF